MPVKPAVLAWAMEDSEVTVEVLAAKVGKDSGLVDEWLSGSKMPYKGDLEKIAKLLGRSTQFFFLPAPPQPSATTARFRAAISGASRDPGEELRSLRAAKAAQRLARWWAEEVSQSVQFPIMEKDPARYAAEVRELLGWSPRLQVNASSKSAVFRALRAHIEQLGVVVLLRPMGEENCRGFSFPDDRAPLIAINSKYKLPTLRTYTLLHEFAHLARGHASVCHDEDTKEERWCDKFAAAFLIPEGHLRKYFESKGWSRVSLATFDRVRLISNRYKASWQSVALRLRDLGLTSQDVVDAVFANSNEDDGGGFNANGGRTTPVVRFDEYGTTFTRAVLGLREAAQITEFDARRQLNVNRDQLESLSSLAHGVV